MLQQIDRRAWATGGPNKPGDLGEAAWEDLVDQALVNIDAHVFMRKDSVRPVPARAEHLDLELLAARAVVEADAQTRAVR